MSDTHPFVAAATAPPVPSAPSVLFVPSIFGVTGEIRDRLHLLAAAGSHAAAVDPFWQVDPGVVAYDRTERALSRMRAVDTSTLRDHLAATARALRDHGQPVIAVGICFGGRHAWWLAQQGLVDGVCAWHPGGLTRDEALGRIPQVPLDLHFGAEDGSIPLAEVEHLREALADHPAATVHVHPGAAHGFTHRDAPPVHDADADSASWAGLLAMRDRLLGA